MIAGTSIYVNSADNASINITNMGGGIQTIFPHLIFEKIPLSPLILELETLGLGEKSFVYPLLNMPEISKALCSIPCSTSCSQPPATER